MGLINKLIPAAGAPSSASSPSVSQINLRPGKIDIKVKDASKPIDIQKTGEILMNIMTVIKVAKTAKKLFGKKKPKKKEVKIQNKYSKGELIMKTIRAFVTTFIVLAIAIVLFVPYVRDENGAYWLFKVPAGGQAYHRTTLGLVLIEKLKALKAKKAEA